MRNQMDDLHSKVLRKFHTLCTRLGMSEYEKNAIKEAYGVESSADIDTHDLIDICNRLSGELNRADAEKDRLRKRVFAAIGGYLRNLGKESSPELIKAIACRSTGYSDFNKIPVERLRNVYSTFTNKQKDMAGSDMVAAAMKMSVIRPTSKYLS